MLSKSKILIHEKLRLSAPNMKQANLSNTKCLRVQNEVLLIIIAASKILDF